MTTEYKMVEGGTDKIGELLTVLSRKGWVPFSNHQSEMKSGSYSTHSILLMRVTKDEINQTPVPATVEYNSKA